MQNQKEYLEQNTRITKFKFPEKIIRHVRHIKRKLKIIKQIFNAQFVKTCYSKIV